MPSAQRRSLSQPEHKTVEYENSTARCFLLRCVCVSCFLCLRSRTKLRRKIHTHNHKWLCVCILRTLKHETVKVLFPYSGFVFQLAVRECAAAPAERHVWVLRRASGGDGEEGADA